jgi:molecular chaperone IbpA
MAEYKMPHFSNMHQPWEKSHTYVQKKAVPELPTGYEAWSIGLENFLRLIQSNNVSRNSSYPPYNILKLDNDHFTVELAVAGFSKETISITKEDNLLKIVGNRSSEQDDKYVHRGIAGRFFSKEFVLAEHIVVIDAKLEDGVLTIELERQIPEDKKPQVIEIK